MNNPYKKCPIFETPRFILRLVSEEDADNLLTCYADPKAQALFNTDGFPHNCNFATYDEMLACIKFWLMEYSQEAYVRFAVVDKFTNKAVGTIEMFGMAGENETRDGILRLDLASAYEEKPLLKKLLGVCLENFYSLFEVHRIASKATEQAASRIEVLQALGFEAGDFNGRGHYYLRSR
jgi:RimJ/RimL family protein N-acetyltransferase